MGSGRKRCLWWIHAGNATWVEHMRTWHETPQVCMCVCVWDHAQPQHPMPAHLAQDAHDGEGGGTDMVPQQVTSVGHSQAHSAWQQQREKSLHKEGDKQSISMCKHAYECAFRKPIHVHNSTNWFNHKYGRWLSHVAMHVNRHSLEHPFDQPSIHTHNHRWTHTHTHLKSPVQV